jgi:hypothetical protein
MESPEWPYWQQEMQEELKKLLWIEIPQLPPGKTFTI